MYTDEELLDLLRELADETEGRLSMKDLNEADGYPGARTYQRRFGSWNAAKEKAGLDTVPRGQPPRYSDEELLEMLRTLAEQCDHPLGEQDVEDAEDLPALSTFENRFGSWNKAKKAAGLDARGRGKASRGHSYTDEELLQFIRDLSRELGGSVMMWDMARAEDYPSPTTYHRRFGSWSAAKEKAFGKADDDRQEK